MDTKSTNLSEIIACYQARLLRYVTQLLWPDSETPQDVVQDTFLRLHRLMAGGKYEAINNLNAWLFRVAHNLALDHLRSRKRRRKLQNHILTDPVINPEENIRNKQHSDALARQEACTLAVQEAQSLPDEQKQVLLLKVMEGMTLQQISTITGLKIGTVNYRLTQALRTLADRLTKLGVCYDM